MNVWLTYYFVVESRGNMVTINATTSLHGISFDMLSLNLSGNFVPPSLIRDVVEGARKELGSNFAFIKSHILTGVYMSAEAAANAIKED